MSKKKKRKAAEQPTVELLEKIKQTAITSLFSDDNLMELLVLKGGNAMDIVYKISSRASVDVDFSVEGNIDYGVVKPKIEAAIIDGFSSIGYSAFDIDMKERPSILRDELASFWGGYTVEFKLISLERERELSKDIEAMRLEAVQLGQGKKFTVDISQYEYTDGKCLHELDEYTIYVYSPAMIVCEKLRAICQQMEEYGEVICRKRAGNQRARDFFDIDILVTKFGVDLSDSSVQEMLKKIFEVKRVPLELLGKIHETRDFHRLGYEQVVETMKPGFEKHPFDYYFDAVVQQVKKLEPLWNV